MGDWSCDNGGCKKDVQVGGLGRGPDGAMKQTGTRHPGDLPDDIASASGDRASVVCGVNQFYDGAPDSRWSWSAAASLPARRTPARQLYGDC